ncbi:hypothetical protein ACGTRS_11070 [Burkholderia semiarida]|uniref:Uncharacterized protein n=1 Tax=Burkholderia semiarida TaxID=2843303 RepID=A0ABW7L2C4_9BURK
MDHVAFGLRAKPRPRYFDAAKAATSAPVSPVEPAAHPVSPRTGRVHVPDGYMPREKPQAADPPRAETTAAPVGGYRLT